MANIWELWCWAVRLMIQPKDWCGDWESLPLGSCAVYRKAPRSSPTFWTQFALFVQDLRICLHTRKIQVFPGITIIQNATKIRVFPGITTKLVAKSRYSQVFRGPISRLWDALRDDLTSCHPPGSLGVPPIFHGKTTTCVAKSQLSCGKISLSDCSYDFCCCQDAHFVCIILIYWIEVILLLENQLNTYCSNASFQAHTPPKKLGSESLCEKKSPEIWRR